MFAAKWHQDQRINSQPTAAFLIVILIFNVCGYYLWFNFAQNRIKREIKAEIRAGLEEKDLSVIEIPIGHEKDIKWLEARKEFLYQGEMYDVVQVKSGVSSQIYLCIRDVKEKELIRDFARQHQTNQRARRMLSSINLQFIDQRLNALYTPEATDREFILADAPLILFRAEISDPPPKPGLQA